MVDGEKNIYIYKYIYFPLIPVMHLYLSVIVTVKVVCIILHSIPRRPVLSMFSIIYLRHRNAL